MKKPKTAQYRRLLEQIQDCVERQSNLASVQDGNTMVLTITNPHRLLDILDRFDKVKKG